MNNKELSFIDIISIASFLIAVQNLDLNISQEDIQKSSMDIENHVNQRLEKALEDIHGHLSVQDAKLSIILEKLEGLEK